MSFCDKYSFVSPDVMDDAMALSILAIFNSHKMQGNDTVFYEKNNSLLNLWSKADKLIRKVEEKTVANHTQVYLLIILFVCFTV